MTTKSKGGWAPDPETRGRGVLPNLGDVRREITGMVAGCARKSTILSEEVAGEKPDKPD
jgi:hypothetical protein